MTTTSRGLLPAKPGPTPLRGDRRMSAGVLLVAAMLGLAGCGGGSDSSPAPAPGPGPSPSPSPGPGPAPATNPPLASNTCEAFPSATGAAASGSLDGKATSPAGRSLTFSLVSQASSGTVQLASTGTFTYSRTAPGRGDADSFVYKVTDTAGLSAEATARVIYGTRRIMPLGDSITDGIETFNQTDGDLPEEPQRVGYRKALRDRLVASGYAVDFVGTLSSGSSAGLVDDEHEGHSGSGQALIRSGIASWLTQAPADVVLLHIGTNDVPGEPSAQPTAAGTNSILQNVNAWSAVPTNPPVHLLLSRIIGQRSNNAEIGTFNNNLVSLYNSNWSDPAGTRPRFVVDMVYMDEKLNTTTDLSPINEDSVGLHPNPTGYGKMANAWFDSLVQNQAIHKCP